MKARVHSFESFGTVDGPGIRFVIFLQGCPLRCLYCHNPDTWSTKGGTEYEVEELVQKVLKYRNYIKSGGVTVSGGEPLVQIDFLIAFFKRMKEEGIHTCCDTSGYLFTPRATSKFDELLKYCDLFLLDIKQIDPEKHKILTKVKSDNILKFARYLSDHKKPMWIRHVLVPGYSDDPNDWVKLRQFIDSLQSVEKVEILPYHTMGVNKYKMMNMSYPLEGVEPPTKDVVANARAIVERGEYDKIS